MPDLPILKADLIRAKDNADHIDNVANGVADTYVSPDGTVHKSLTKLQSDAQIQIDAARAAAEASGATKLYDTKAAAVADLASISNLEVVEVFVDESLTGTPRAIYRKESGSLVFKCSFLKSDLTIVIVETNGTFVPAFTWVGGGTPPDFSLKSGRFVRQGSMVTVFITAQLDNLHGGSGYISIANLPYTVSNIQTSVTATISAQALFGYTNFNHEVLVATLPGDTWPTSELLIMSFSYYTADV